MATEPMLNRIRLPQRMKCCPRERARREAKGPRKTPRSRLATNSLAKLDVLSASVDNVSPSSTPIIPVRIKPVKYTSATNTLRQENLQKICRLLIILSFMHKIDGYFLIG